MAMINLISQVFPMTYFQKGEQESYIFPSLILTYKIHANDKMKIIKHLATKRGDKALRAHKSTIILPVLLK